MPPLLSVIIPAHNEERRLPGSLSRVTEFLRSQSFESEVIVVENASHDRTAEVALEYARASPPVRLMREARRGKGLAVRIGMLESKAAYRFICDADLSMPIEEILRFLPPRLEGFDVAIASREVPGAARYNEPVYRHWIGRGFNLLVRVLAVPGFHDTQCGFKCFAGAAADDLFRSQVLDGWTFDAEVLFLALHRGYRVVEVPIPWYYVPGSRVRLFRDSLAMLVDLFTIRRNWRRGVYGRPG